METWNDIKDKTNDEIAGILDKDHHADYTSLYKYLKNDKLRENFELFADSLGFDFSGKKVLEIGPGRGDFLDIVQERGALTTFIDRDVFISRYCQNKGHRMIRMDYIPHVIDGTIFDFNEQYDLVVAIGAFNFDFFNTGFKIKVLLDWIDSIHKECVVITPAWDKGELTDGEYNTCTGEKLDRYIKSNAHNLMMKYGYSTVFLKGINYKLRPISYHK